MVNWRENVEFCYVLFVLISGVVAFFTLYARTSMIYAGIWVVIIVVIQGVIGAIAFETDWAIAEWEKLGKKKPA